jgi:hypothetical protein
VTAMMRAPPCVDCEGVAEPPAVCGDVDEEGEGDSASLIV